MSNFTIIKYIHRCVIIQAKLFLQTLKKLLLIDNINFKIIDVIPRKKKKKRLYLKRSHKNSHYFKL